MAAPPTGTAKKRRIGYIPCEINVVGARKLPGDNEGDARTSGGVCGKTNPLNLMQSTTIILQKEQRLVRSVISAMSIKIGKRANLFATPEQKLFST